MFLSTVSIAGALALGTAPPARRIGVSETPRAKNPRDGPVDSHRVASDIELFAACYRAGLPTITAAEAVADTYSPDDWMGQRWSRVVAYLSLGIEPETAWEPMDGVPGCEDLAALVALSHASGSALAQGCERIAGQLRDRAADEAVAKAERAGVMIGIPLAVFFLPAFFVLGLAPVVIGLGTEMFSH